jgi:DoxX-like family
MNGKTANWIATLAVCAFMAYNAYAYLTHDPKMMAAFASLGYPTYFPTILGIAKVLGILALLVNGAVRLKEWAYAGFTFTFIGALCSHLASGQQKAALMPVVVLIVLVISYLLRPPGRRLIEAPCHNP